MRKLPRRGPTGKLYPAARPRSQDEQSILEEAKRVLRESKQLMAELGRPPKE